MKERDPISVLLMKPLYLRELLSFTISATQNGTIANNDNAYGRDADALEFHFACSFLDDCFV
jgi:hypothetical protein